MSVLFVCMGNICRSPLAEGIARHAFESADAAPAVRFDSAGTHAYHVGQPPDPRAIAVAGHFGVKLGALRARQVDALDFQRFDLILAADRRNLAELKRLRPTSAGAELDLLLPWCGLSRQDVPDPYYGDVRDFEQVFQLLAQAVEGLRQRLS
jgi:protein-tyrosine phosphatase